MKCKFDPSGPRRPLRSRRGSSLVLVIIITALLAGLAGAALTFTSASVTEVESEHLETQALYLAEAGVNEAFARLATSHRTGNEVGASIGTMDAPVEDPSGERWTTITDNGDGGFTVMSTGIVARSMRTVEAIVRPTPPGPFDHAIFAGNLDGDPAYALKVNGTGGQSDIITGNVYAGGDVIVDQDGEINGEVRAGGIVSGTDGMSGVRMNIPMTLDVDYEIFNDYDVAALFAGAPRGYDDSGGYADQLPESSPVHFLRRNPSDRGADVSGTLKDDYFLEDPYETVRPDYAEEGADAFAVSLPAEVNNSVIFIDGNLWIHNRQTMSLKIKNDGLEPTRVTFVVKGNVYFSDNFFYDDPDQDGVAFVAISDENVEDSGNVYFGDPMFGTMKFAEAVMFAENNFYDNNLSASGSTQVKIRGNMTAANQVAIQRDYELSGGVVAHTKLDLEFDARQATGLISLPGIPIKTDDPVGYQIASWREVATPRNFALDAATVRSDKGPSTVTAPDTGDKWRERWEAKFGKEWKDTKRQNKWRKKQEERARKRAEKEAMEAAEEAAAEAAPEGV